MSECCAGVVGFEPEPDFDEAYLYEGYEPYFPADYPEDGWEGSGGLGLGELSEAGLGPGVVLLDPLVYKLSAPAEELTTHALGAEGERVAAQYLEDEGYELLERNWRCRLGEADIVARADASTVVMVEVKTRRSRRPDESMPEVAVNEAKRARYAKLAALYLANNPEAVSSVRFDVIAIAAKGAEPLRLRYIMGAYGLGL